MPKAARLEAAGARRALWKGPALWAMTGLAWAQAPHLGSPFITNHETEQYKASNQNWAAVQDRRGVLYFGNTSGILEFDGQHWRKVPTPMDTVVRGLACGPDGTLYYGAAGDIGYLATSSTGKVSAVSLKEALPEAERSFNDVWQVESSRDGVYFMTVGRMFRYQGGRATVVPARFTSSQACVLNGTLFFEDADQGICMAQGDQVVPLPFLKGVSNGKRIHLAPFGPHGLLVGRRSGDFLRIDLAPLWDEATHRYLPDRAATGVSAQPFPAAFGALLKEDQASIYSLVPLGAEAFALCTLRAGILIFDRSGRLLRAVNKEAGLLENTISSALVDRSGDLWVTSNSGISHVELSVPQSLFGPRNGLEGMPLTVAFHAGRLYVGTFQKTYQLAPHRYGANQPVPRFEALKGSPSEVWQFLEVGGDLLAASDSGLYQIQGDRATKLPGPPGGGLSLGVTRRWPDRLFMGLMGGLEVYARRAGRWTWERRIEGVRENITAITADARGDLWLSTDIHGLIRVRFTGTKPADVTLQRFGPEQGLPSLLNLRAAARGEELQVLTPKGLFRARVPAEAPADPQTIRFWPDAGLGRFFADPPLGLDAMTSDGRGGWFFVTSEGVGWATAGSDGTFQWSTRPFQGLPNTVLGVYAHPDGSVWLPGKALYRVDLTAPKAYDQSFQTLIRHVSTGGGRSLFEGAHGAAPSAVPDRRTVFAALQGPGDIPELAFQDNALSFTYAAAFFERPGTTEFQHQLEGFDRGWSPWSAATLKEYTNIPEGRYRFRVRARNLYGTVGQEAVYAFRILPPWYRTLWAILLWLASGGAILVGGVYLYTLKLRQQKRRLEALVAERTRELQEASLTDPLTGLRNRRFTTEVLLDDVNAFVDFKLHALKARMVRGGHPDEEVFGVFLLDLDHFKSVNDVHGHDAGDRLLKQFADVLRSLVRKDDVVIRLGGEEFLVVLKKTLPGFLPSFAEKLLKQVAETPFEAGGGVVLRKTCSVGFVGFPLYAGQPDLLTFEQTVMVADLGMYHAKQRGRNQAVWLAEGPRRPAGREGIMRVVGSLEQALAEGQLRVEAVQFGPPEAPGPDSAGLH